EGALGASAGFGRGGEDMPDAEGVQRALHLGVVDQVRCAVGGHGAAEVAAAVGIELGEAPIAREHVVESVKRGRRILLRPELGVEDAAVGIVWGPGPNLQGPAAEAEGGGSRW